MQCPACGFMAAPEATQCACGAALAIVPKADVTSSGGFEQLSFHGTGDGLFKLMLMNLLFTVGTLGIYHFWAKTEVRKFMHSQLELQGDRFAYHGTGWELLKARMKAFGIIFLPFFVLGIVAGLTKNPGVEILSNLLLVVVLVTIMPLAIVGSLRYRLSHTSWHGIRFSFRGKVLDLIKVFVPNALLTIVTLGFWLPVTYVKMAEFLASNVYFGNTPLKFHGQVRDIYGKYILGIVFTYLTLGIHSFWLQANLDRFFWQNVSFGEARFRSTVSGEELFWLRIVNMLNMVGTLGLGAAWVKVRTARFKAEHLEIIGKLDLGSVKQELQKAGAFGDSLVDALDMDFGLGV